MELPDIIVNTLKIFCFTVITIITVSYLIYKIRSRKKSTTYFDSFKKHTDPVKIIYKKSDVDKNHFESVNSLNGIPPGIISGINSGSAKYVTSAPGLTAVKASGLFLGARQNKINIMNHYSVDKSDVMYKIKKQSD